MYAWLIETFGEQNALYIAYGAGAVGVLLLIWVLWFWTRRVSGGVFVHGGRGRKPRLAVVDAAAIDSHRRIVLVRRDDVEHLVMIGGHNDFVIERGIGAEQSASGEEPVAPPREQPLREKEKHRREAAVTKPREPEIAEKAPQKEAPPPAPVPKPAPAPQPVLQAERPQPQPVSPPEPPQNELPRDYAAVREEPPVRRVVEAAPLQAASIPAAYAEHAETAVDDTPRAPAFDINPEPVVESREPASGFEDHVRASIAEAEATIAGAPANDGSLEDEMQKLLNELTRKK